MGFWVSVDAKISRQTLKTSHELVQVQRAKLHPLNSATRHYIPEI